MAIPLIPFIATAFTWLLREVVVKFLIFTAVFALVAFFVPYAVGYLGKFADASVFSNAFAAIDGSVWFVLKFFKLDYGVPLIISAYVSRFLIRRLPVIG